MSGIVIESIGEKGMGNKDEIKTMVGIISTKQMIPKEKNKRRHKNHM